MQPREHFLPRGVRPIYRCKECHNGVYLNPEVELLSLDTRLYMTVGRLPDRLRPSAF